MRPGALDLTVTTWWDPSHAVELLAHCAWSVREAMGLLELLHAQAHRHMKAVIDLREHLGHPVGLTEAIAAHQAVCDEVARRRRLLREVARAQGLDDEGGADG